MNEDRPGLSFTLALLVHGALFAFLYFSVQWTNQPIAPVQVELWSPPPPVSAAVPKVKPAPKAKPAPPEEEPEPEPPRKAEIEDVPKPRPKTKERPPAVKPEPKPEKTKPEKKPESKVEKLPEKKVEKLVEKKNPPSERDSKIERPTSKPTEQVPKVDTAALIKQMADQQHAAEQAANARLLDGYINVVRRRIKDAMNFPDDETSNPEVICEVALLPDMSVLDVTVRKASGNPAFDEAVKRAILRLGQYPPLPAGLRFSDFRRHSLTYKMR